MRLAFALVPRLQVSPAQSDGILSRALGLTAHRTQTRPPGPLCSSVWSFGQVQVYEIGQKKNAHLRGHDLEGQSLLLVLPLPETLHVGILVYHKNDQNDGLVLGQGQQTYPTEDQGGSA